MALSTVLNCPQDVQFFDRIVKLGFQPNIVTYGAMIKGLSSTRNNAGALSSGRWIKPNVVTYISFVWGVYNFGFRVEAEFMLD